MFIAIPCNIAEPAGFAFRQNTNSRKESLLVGIFVAMNYQWEMRQLIDILREGGASSGSRSSKKEREIMRNQLRVQNNILSDRRYISSKVSNLVSGVTTYNHEKDVSDSKKTDKDFHKSDSNPPDI